VGRLLRFVGGGTMGSACSSSSDSKQVQTITLDMATLERLQQEFNDVDVGQV